MEALTTVHEAMYRQRDMMIKRRSNALVNQVFESHDSFGGAFGNIDRNAYVTEQSYMHNRGEPYAATRPIAQRIAGQPIHVAEIVRSSSDQPGEKAYRIPKHGRRRLSVEEMAKLPKWLRNKLKLPTTDDIGECVKAIKSMHSAAVRVDILEQHPVLDLMSNPNPRANGHTFLDESIVSLQFTGRCYWWLTKTNPNRPYDMWYLPAQRVREQDNNVMLDKGYLVSPPHAVAGSGDDIPIPAKFMIYFYHPDPADPMRALAPIRACMQNVRVGESITTCQEQTYNNGLNPGMLVITGDIIAPDGKNMGKAQLERWQINELQLRLGQDHKGPMKFNKPIILDRAINDVKPYTNKPQEMGFTDSYNFNRDAIWRSIGTPPIVAGATEDANRATALVADEAFCGNVVNPRSALLSHVMNDRLLPLFNEDNEPLVMWIEESVSVDRDAVMKEITMMVSKRAITIDEVRAKLGYPPLPNDKGKVLCSSATDIFEPVDDKDDEAVAYREEFLEDQAQAAKPPAKPSSGKPRDGTQVQKPPPSADETATGKMFSDAELAEVFSVKAAAKDRAVAWLKIHGTQEKSFAKDLKKFLDAQVRYIVHQINAESEPAKIFNPREWDNGLVKLARPHLLRSCLTGAKTELAKSGTVFRKSDDVLIEIPPEVVAAIREHLNEVFRMQYWRDVNDTTATRLATQIQASLQAGESIQQMSKRVHDTLGSQTPARALMIARSETTGGLNAGSYAAFQDMKERGIVTTRAWFANDDAFTRATHWEAHDQREDENGEFTVGGEKCRYPGDPRLSAAQRVNCRCSQYTVQAERSSVPHIKSMLAGPGQMFERIERRFLVDNAAPIIQQLLNHGKIREYGLTTLYLDHRVPTWSIRQGNGVKFRLRRYDTGELFFEQKVKRDGVTYKKRRKTEIKEVDESLIPVGIACYVRTEFEQNGSRVTVDRDVRLNGKSFGRFIVEVKGKMPEWLNLPEGSEQVGFSKSSAILNYV